LPFIPLQMNALGLSRDEAVIVSGVAPLIALIGPLVAAPLADRLAGKNKIIVIIRLYFAAVILSVPRWFWWSST